MMLRAAILLMAFLGTVVSACGQGTGVRIIVPEYNKKFQKGPNKGWQFGIGVDHDLGDRLAMGLDLVMDLRSLSDPGRSEYVNVAHGAYTAHYERTSKMVSVIYRSAYFFSGNDGGLYLGSYVGVRSVRQEVRLNQWDGPSSVNPFTTAASAARTVMPVGIRLGARSALDGGLYEDLYVQVGYCVGGGRSGFSQVYLQEADALTLPRFTFSVGLAFGIAW